MLKKIGKYEITGTIGSGAMGAVYKGYDPALERYVAIKTMSPHLMTSAESRARFQVEAKALAKLRHDNIVTIHELAEENGVPFIVMEYIAGRNLKQTLEAGRNFNLPSIMSILVQAASGLDCAHQQGIIHRDVKPANLILSAEGKVKIVDFGIARLAEGTMHTQAGVAMGTVAYMSPEQARGEKLDPRSDQFSLGVIAYELVCGQVPFQADHYTAVMFKIINEPMPPLPDDPPRCPPALADVIGRALEKDRGRRFSNVAEFARACEEIRQNLSTVAATAATAGLSLQPSFTPEPELAATRIEEHPAAELKATQASGFSPATGPAPITPPGPVYPSLSPVVTSGTSSGSGLVYPRKQSAAAPARRSYTILVAGLAAVGILLAMGIVVVGGYFLLKPTPPRLGNDRETVRENRLSEEQQRKAQELLRPPPQTQTNNFSGEGLKLPGDLGGTTQPNPEGKSKGEESTQNAQTEVPGLYPEGSTRLLNEADLEGLSLVELRIMRNEIYARHGRIFKSEDLRAYFSTQPWYKPCCEDVTDKLSNIEKQNILFIKQHE